MYQRLSQGPMSQSTLSQTPMSQTPMSQRLTSGRVLTPISAQYNLVGSPGNTSYPSTRASLTNTLATAGVDLAAANSEARVLQSQRNLVARQAEATAMSAQVAEEEAMNEAMLTNRVAIDAQNFANETRAASEQAQADLERTRQLSASTRQSALQATQSATQSVSQLEAPRSARLGVRVPTATPSVSLPRVGSLPLTSINTSFPIGASFTAPSVSAPLVAAPLSTRTVTAPVVSAPLVSTSSSPRTLTAPMVTSSLTAQAPLVPSHPRATSVANMAVGSLQQTPLQTKVQSLREQILTQHQSIREPLEIKDYAGLVQGNYETELLKSGYAPLGKIIATKDDGTEVEYIKAINSMGQKVFVLLDEPGFMNSTISSLSMRSAPNAELVPYSIKIGASKCAGLDVCGVAFECGDSVCVLERHDRDLTPRETTFKVIHSSEPEVGKMQVTKENMVETVALPIVRLSEIRVNPDTVLENTNIVTRRLRNQEYRASLEKFTEMKTKLRGVERALSVFDQRQAAAANALNINLTEAERVHKIYQRMMLNGNLSDADKIKYQNLQKHMAHLNDGITALMQLLKRILAVTAGVDYAIQQIEQLSQYNYDIAQ